MSHITYRISEHNGGWAYKQGDSFSETFRSHDEARAAAIHACREQRVPGEAANIEYQDAAGQWVTERAYGNDRPNIDVEG